MDASILEPLEALPAEMALLGLRAFVRIHGVLARDQSQSTQRDQVHRLAVHLVEERLSLTPSDARHLLCLVRRLESTLKLRHRRASAARRQAVAAACQAIERWLNTEVPPEPTTQEFDL